eukprot:3308067-Pleurochrysis_carterae.AAC.2
MRAVAAQSVLRQASEGFFESHRRAVFSIADGRAAARALCARARRRPSARHAMRAAVGHARRRQGSLAVQVADRCCGGHALYARHEPQQRLLQQADV